MVKRKKVKRNELFCSELSFFMINFATQLSQLSINPKT